MALAAMFVAFAMQAQETGKKYIEVTGVSEIEIVPDKIHYIIEIKEYFEEEFKINSTPEEYRTKMPISKIENGLRTVLRIVGIPSDAIRTQEIGDYWRQPGKDFLVSKKFDITLTDFDQIDEIVKHINTRSINTMYIGELENKDMSEYHRKGKIEALKAAQRKASYLAEALGKTLGDVIRIEEVDNNGMWSPLNTQSNFSNSDAASFDRFRTIKKNYSIRARFEIKD